MVISPLMAGLLTQPAKLSKRAKAPSPRAKAEAQRIEALKALRHWGHLRSGDVARLLWPQYPFGEQMAQRLLRRLDEERGEVASRLNALGTRSYVLTRRGVAALDVLNLAAHHGLELCSVGGATFIHRALGTAFGITKLAQGFESYGEHAIAQGMAPARRDELVKRYKKLPDLLLVQGIHVTWVEVEASAKPLRELQACLRIASAVGQPLLPGSQLRLSALVFAFDASQGHGQRIVRAARQAWSDKSCAERGELAARVSLAHAALGPFVRWTGMDERPLVL